jgi:hypothetical protein
MTEREARLIGAVSLLIGLVAFGIGMAVDARGLSLFGFLVASAAGGVLAGLFTERTAS